MNAITSKHGLLWQDGMQIPLPEADSIAIKQGYQCAEQMVKALSTPKPLNPLTQQPYAEGELSTVVKLGNQLIAVQSEIATLEAALELNQKKQFALLTKTLPDAMKAIGMSAFKMDNGAEVKIIPFYQCSVSDKDPDLKEKALKWLRTHDAGSLIKHEFKAILGTEAESLVKSLRGFLNKKSIPFKDGQNVNAATLKSFMKETIEAGKPFPLDIFKGYTGNIAKVEMPKS